MSWVLLKKHSGTVGLVIKTAIIFGMIAGGYYWFVLQPGTALRKAYLRAERQLSNQDRPLRSFTLSLSELEKLKPNSSGFNETQTTLLASISHDYNAEQSQLKNGGIVTKTYSAPSPKLVYLNRTVTQQQRLLANRFQSLLPKQKRVMNSVLSLQTTVREVFNFDPEQQLVALKIDGDTDLLGQRARAAEVGLGTISQKVSGISLAPDNKAALVEHLGVMADGFAQLSKACTNKDFAGATTIRQQIVSSYPALRTSAYMLVSGFLASPEVFQLESEQSKLLQDYQTLANQIEDRRRHL